MESSSDRTFIDRSEKLIQELQIPDASLEEEQPPSYLHLLERKITTAATTTPMIITPGSHSDIGIRFPLI